MSHGEFVVFCSHRVEEVAEEGVRGFRARSGMWEEGWAPRPVELEALMALSLSPLEKWVSAALPLRPHPSSHPTLTPTPPHFWGTFLCELLARAALPFQPSLHCIVSFPG